MKIYRLYLILYPWLYAKPACKTVDKPDHPHFIQLLGSRNEVSEMGRVAAQIQSLNQAGSVKE